MADSFSPSVAGWLIAAGASSFFGACTANRSLAMLGVMRHGFAHAAAYIGGTVLSYAIILAGVDRLQRLLSAAPLLSLLLAVMLIGSGFWRLARPAEVCCSHEHVPAASGSFLLGLGMGLCVSPCCLPALLGIASFIPIMSSAQLFPYAMSFALGQVAPLTIFAMAVPVWHRYAATPTPMLREIFDVVSAAMSIALGTYYALLCTV